MNQIAEYTARARDWWTTARVNPLFWKGGLAAIAIVLVDQLSKYWIVHQVRLQEQLRPCFRNPENICGQIHISPIFDLTYVQNYGASFGILDGMRWPLAILSTVIAAGLLYWLGGLKRRAAAVGVAFVVGGALGNLYDRIAYGYVIDFFDFSGLMFPWVFNVADASINVGIAFILLDAWLTRDDKSAA